MTLKEPYHLTLKAQPGRDVSRLPLQRVTTDATIDKTPAMERNPGLDRREENGV
jgi:hypothetical protein